MEDYHHGENQLKKSEKIPLIYICLFLLKNT